MVSDVQDRARVVMGDTGGACGREVAHSAWAEQDSDEGRCLE